MKGEVGVSEKRGFTYTDQRIDLAEPVRPSRLTVTFQGLDCGPCPRGLVFFHFGQEVHCRKVSTQVRLPIIFSQSVTPTLAPALKELLIYELFMNNSDPPALACHSAHPFSSCEPEALGAGPCLGWGRRGWGGGGWWRLAGCCESSLTPKKPGLGKIRP